MTKREQRVVNAFLLCIEHGEYSEEYAITLIEDNQRYGWLSNAAKDDFYSRLPSEQVAGESAEEAVDEPIEETETEID